MAKKRPPKNEPSSPQETWRAGGHPVGMLQAAHGRLSPRQLRLYAIACCKSVFGESRSNVGYSELLQLAERMTDCPEQEMAELIKQAVPFRRFAYPHGVIHLLNENAMQSANYWSFAVDIPPPAEILFRAEVLREIAGDPFADIHLDPALLTWRDHAIPKLARLATTPTTLA